MPVPPQPPRKIVLRITPAEVTADELRIKAARRALFQTWLDQCREIHEQG